MVFIVAWMPILFTTSNIYLFYFWGSIDYLIKYFSNETDFRAINEIIDIGIKMLYNVVTRIKISFYLLINF